MAARPRVLDGVDALQSHTHLDNHLGMLAKQGSLRNAWTLGECGSST